MLLLLVTAACAYLYHNLDTLVQRQVRASLGEFGVYDYRVTGPRLGAGRFTAAGLTLRGNYNGLDYDLVLDNLAIHYDWRILLTRKLRLVSLAGLEARAAGTLDLPADEATPGTRTLDIAGMTPRELLAGLPTRALEIDRLRLEYRAAEEALIVSSGHLRYGEALDISVNTDLSGANLAASLRAADGSSPLLLDIALAEGRIPLATIRGQLATPARNTLAWRINADWQHGPLLQWATGLAASLGTPLPAVVAEGDGALVASIRHPGLLRFGPAPPWQQENWQQLTAIEAEARLTGNVAQLDLPGLAGLQAAELDLTLSLSDGVARLEVAPLAVSADLGAPLVTIPAETRRWLGWAASVPLHWQSTAPLQFGFDGVQSTLQLPAASLRLGNDQSRLALQQLELHAAVAGSPREAGTRLRARFDARLGKQQLPELDLSLRQEGPLEDARVNLELEATAGKLGAQVGGTLNLPLGKGGLDLALRSDDLADLPEALLPALRGLGLLGADLALEAGTLSLASRLENTGQAWQQTSLLAVQEVSGQYGEYRFDGLSLQGAVTGGSGLRTTRPLSLSLARLNVGFDITDITARAGIPRESPAAAPALSLDAFSADLFGGRVFLPGTGYWDFGAASNSLTLRAEGWQLGQIVALQQSEDIQARGVLEGELPVTLADGRLSIDKGYLRALPPGGTIRYIANDASRALGRNSKELELALNLLSDFRYEVLSSDVELDQSGNLLLGLSLSGHNPTQYEGRKVNFNINLEQNLDPLLQSLRLSGKLTGEIENRLK